MKSSDLDLVTRQAAALRRKRGIGSILLLPLLSAILPKLVAMIVELLEAQDFMVPTSPNYKASRDVLDAIREVK